jgi:hypothetical protein
MVRNNEIMMKHPSTPRRLHLRRELDVIRGAVEAARILGEAIATSQLGPEADHRRAPRALTSLLSLVSARLRVLRRAARRGRPLLPFPLRAPTAAPPPRLSSDERMLALCALRQSRHAGGAVRRARAVSRP